jgi:hypothetical protein
VANTLAYYDMAIITAVKKFYSTGPCTIKIAKIVNYAARGIIYDHSVIPIL